MRKTLVVVAVLVLVAGVATVRPSRTTYQYGRVAIVTDGQGTPLIASWNGPRPVQETDLYALYRHIGGRQPNDDEFNVVFLCDLLGQDGWQLCSVDTPMDGLATMYYFSRPRP